MTDVWRKYWTLMMTNATFSTVHVINIGWMTFHTRNPEERSIGSVLLVMAANTGAIAGANVFRNDDTFLYRRAFRNVTFIAAADVALIIFLGLYYLWKRKRTDKAPAPTMVA